MYRNLLDKHKDDPSWAEVIRLYSGLFDTQDERENFIIDLAETDILLAAECKTSSIEEEFFLMNNLTNLCQNNNQNFVDAEITAKIFLSLIEIDKLTEIVQILSNVKVFNKIHKDSLEYFVKSAREEQLINFLEIVINLDNTQNKQLLEFTFDCLKGANEFEKINSTIRKRVESIVKLLIKNNLRKELALSYFIGNLLLCFGDLEFEFLDKQDLGMFLYSHNRNSQKQYFETGKRLLKQTSNSKELQDDSNCISSKEYKQKFKKLKTLIDNKSNIQWAELSLTKIEGIIYSQNDNYVSVKTEEIKKDCRIRINELPKGAILNIGDKITGLLNNPDKKGVIWLDYIGFKNNLSIKECEISNIISSRVFVKIKDESRKASIFIGELDNIRIENIFDFEYNGIKLHIGQKLIAKVISIDEKFGINLSLKALK